ncbi:flagellar motor switch protein FliN [Bosea vaviloviae]|uniref:Flagellar motor switch protein FliN n=1 Tax=Bosea vaviloviae TaxID=1526658 RepID=A0A1D7TW03_9HYPH|nr:flagellar motor switch protein FliN [Bosea vaviloviae]AOO79297.1 flagellar motor switch protein FliN [Bosea vaviloviae]
MTKPNKSVKLPELTSEEMPAGLAEAETESVSATADRAPGAVAEANEMLNLDAVMRIPVNIQVVLGSATMQVANLMKLRRGAVVQLDHRVGEPVDVVVNGRIIARGEVVIVEDDNSRFGVSLTEIVGVQAKFEA